MRCPVALLGAALLWGAWGALAGAATLSPSLSNCYPDCEVGGFTVPSEATPLPTLRTPDALPPDDTGLIDYLDLLTGPGGDAGAARLTDPPLLYLDIAPAQGTFGAGPDRRDR